MTITTQQRRKFWLATAAVLAIGVSSAPAAAQTVEEQAAAANEQAADADPAAVDQPTDGDIIVTARRRAESLQDVPIALTVYSGEALERGGAVDITDISDTTPNVTLETSRGSNTTLTAFIRGVGQQDPVAGFEQGVGLYLDDVFINRPQAAVLDIYDVERIEVLRGPQGTLYGRNTIGGAIKYVTRRLGGDPSLLVPLGVLLAAGALGAAAHRALEAVRVRGGQGGEKCARTLETEHRRRITFPSRPAVARAG